MWFSLPVCFNRCQGPMGVFEMAKFETGTSPAMQWGHLFLCLHLHFHFLDYWCSHIVGDTLTMGISPYHNKPFWIILVCFAGSRHTQEWVCPKTEITLSRHFDILSMINFGTEETMYLQQKGVSWWSWYWSWYFQMNPDWLQDDLSQEEADGCSRWGHWCRHCHCHWRPGTWHDDQRP